ncbi:MAG: LbtU family siderophore porin [Candidatus Thiodiazotropha sp.]|jgi:hypothetical protein
MKRAILALWGCTAVFSHAAFSDTAKEEWETGMEQRLQELEQRVQEQESKPDKTRAAESGWQEGIEFAGLIEVEASRVSPDQGDSTSDLNVATVELGLETRVNPWVAVEILLLYEEETDNDGDFNIDTALIALADPNANWFLKAGRNTLPFGAYPTQMISDPLTLELGETNDTALEVGYAVEGFEFSLFLFQGDHNNKADDFGGQLGYQHEFADMALQFNLGYLDNLAESDAIVDGGWITTDRKMAAWVGSAQLEAGPLTLIGEYLDVRDGFADASNQAPSVYNVEGGFGFDLRGRPASVALGYQASDEADDANWGLPEKRIIGAFSVELFEQTQLGIEYRQDESYAGEKDDTLTAQLAVSF